jgi:hypothetical protein
MDWSDDNADWDFGGAPPSGFDGHIGTGGTLDVVSGADEVTFPGDFSGGSWAPSGGVASDGNSWDGTGVSVPETSGGVAASALFFPLLITRSRKLLLAW